MIINILFNIVLIHLITSFLMTHKISYHGLKIQTYHCLNIEVRGQKPESDSSTVYFLPWQEARNSEY